MTDQQRSSANLGAPPPLVSVPVPSYNGARFLREALDSILAQRYPNLEIIPLDDASTDETPSIAAEYSDRVTYIRQTSNLGIHDNVNVGIARARGELIATYHADDLYLPTIVETQVTYLTAHPEVGAVFCADIVVVAEGQEYSRLVLPPEVRGNRPLDYQTVLTTLLASKNRFLAVGGTIERLEKFWNCDRTSDYPGPTCDVSHARPLTAAAAHIGRHAAPGEVILSWRTTAIYLLTGHVGESARLVERIPRGVLADSMRARGVRYALLTGMTEYERGRLAAALQESCRKLRVEAHFRPTALLLVPLVAGDTTPDACAAIVDFRRDMSDVRKVAQ